MISNQVQLAQNETATLRRFSSEEYLRMVKTGVLGRDDKVELIDGLIVAMSPAGSRHNHVLTRLLRAFAPLLERYELAVQGTLHITEGQVYDPDFMLLERKPRGYWDALPTVADAVLIIEVAETSLQRDQQAKLPVYAAAGLAEYWIIDIERQCVLVHREPSADRYISVETRSRGQNVSPLAAPDLSITVDQFFD